jgi:hypothetical protein
MITSNKQGRNKTTQAQRSSLYTSIQVTVILAGKRVSSARDGNFKYVHVAWIPAVHAGMTGFVTFVYNDESVPHGGVSWTLVQYVGNAQLAYA